MQRSKVECYAHLVWATRGREPFLTAELERVAHRCIVGEIEKLRCTVLAIGGMSDHVHCVVQMHSTVAIAKLAQAIKGNSSKLLNHESHYDGAFDWQDNYGAFSVSRSHLKRVVAYVKNQKVRHTQGSVWQEWEETQLEWDDAAMSRVF